MKLLITAIDAIIDSRTNDYFDGIKEALETFQDLQDGNTVVIISIKKDKLDSIPNDFKKLSIGDYSYRKSPKLIEIISEQTGVDYEDILLLGSKDADLALSANAKILLLTADYAKSNNPQDRIYTNGYGIGILSPERLKLFFERFLHVDKPWYYSLKVDDDTKLFGLTNAMTRKMVNADVRTICDSFRGYLKLGQNTNLKSQFLIYSLICTYRIFKDIDSIDYWGYYPSSQVGENPVLKTLKEILRKSFNSRATHDIIIRHKGSPKRQHMTTEQRVNDGCDSQFDSIYINPWYKGRLKGNNVCIIDDFTNLGTSCETIRSLLKAAGVNKIVFIALGKFREEYKMYDYTLEGDLYTPNGYTYKRSGYKTINGNINNESSNELYESLNHILV